MNAAASASYRSAAELPDDEPHDTFCGWCDAHETAGEPHRDDCPLRVTPCRGCGSIHCDSACPEYRHWLTVAFLNWDAARAASESAE